MDRSARNRRLATYLLTALVAAIGFARLVAEGMPNNVLKALWSAAAVFIVTALVYVLLRYFLLADPLPGRDAGGPAEQCGRIAAEIDALVERLRVKAAELEREGRFQAAELTRFDLGQLQTLADRMRGLSRRLREPVDEEAA